jgi:hypothetical protein
MRVWILWPLLLLATSVQLQTQQQASEGSQNPGPTIHAQNITASAASGAAKNMGPVLETRRADAAGQEGSEFWPSIHGVRLKITDSVMALATVLLCWFAARQLGSLRTAADAARKAADVAEATLLATQRAYVLARPHSAFNMGSTGTIDAVTFWFSLENEGNSPALGVVDCISIAFHVKGDGTAFDYAQSFTRAEQAAAGIIGVHSASESSRVALSVGHMLEVIEGRADVYLSGWLEHQEIIGNTPRRGVEWCFKVHIEGILVPGQGDVRFSFHGDHNRYYDCPPETSKTAVKMLARG